MNKRLFIYLFIDSLDKFVITMHIMTLLDLLDALTCKILRFLMLLVLIFQALYHVFWGRGRKGSNGSHNGILFRFMQKDFSKKGNGTDCWRSRGLSLYLWWDLYFFSALRNLVPVLFIGLNKNNVVILKQECWCFV